METRGQRRALLEGNVQKATIKDSWCFTKTYTQKVSQRNAVEISKDNHSNKLASLDASSRMSFDL